ncbi:hypothetical protein F2Q69_00037948 [Brassica cretica]|uniref:Uncharacterized protein n=1 Tax=Brassica cretica TaxID=69181 RepID=A0A8S9SSD8_BRACR|nr:hypothetical protein F2Q69_00037948 [Brassica cretica]
MWPAKKKNARGAGGEHKGSESSISRKKRESSVSNTSASELDSWPNFNGRGFDTPPQICPSVWPDNWVSNSHSNKWAASRRGVSPLGVEIPPVAARGRRIALTLLIVLVLVTTGIDAISSTMALFFFFVCGEIGAQEGGESESTVMTTTGF